MPKDLLEKFDGEFDELAQEYIPYEGTSEIRTLAHSHIEEAYQSNLERLIEKIEYSDIFIQSQYSATFGRKEWTAFVPGNISGCYYATPTEAVENLIKALNKQ